MHVSLQQEDSVRTLGAEGLFLFSSLDTDRDLYLSPEEFKPIAEKLTGTSQYLLVCLSPVFTLVLLQNVNLVCLIQSCIDGDLLRHHSPSGF